MRLAIFSDIHANWEALQTAVDDCRKRGIERFIVLGDTVGYGADPNECLDWVFKHAEINLMGNHEKAVIDPDLRNWFNEWAREAIIWTESEMDGALKKRIPEMDYAKVASGLSYAHGSPDSPAEFRYLMSFDDAAPSFECLETPVCFVGHTHVPGCICLETQSFERLKPGLVHLEKERKYILNPGSVGQPRDRDPRLAYGIFDEQQYTFEIVRLNYANDKAAAKIRKAGLPAYLADRLL